MRLSDVDTCKRCQASGEECITSQRKSGRVLGSKNKKTLLRLAENIGKGATSSNKGNGDASQISDLLTPNNVDLAQAFDARDVVPPALPLPMRMRIPPEPRPIGLSVTGAYTATSHAQKSAAAAYDQIYGTTQRPTAAASTLHETAQSVSYHDITSPSKVEEPFQMFDVIQTSTSDIG